jgi:hypothetical protein
MQIPRSKTPAARLVYRPKTLRDNKHNCYILKYLLRDIRQVLYRINDAEKICRWQRLSIGAENQGRAARNAIWRCRNIPTSDSSSKFPAPLIARFSSHINTRTLCSDWLVVWIRRAFPVYQEQNKEMWLFYNQPHILLKLWAWLVIGCHEVSVFKVGP